MSRRLLDTDILLDDRILLAATTDASELVQLFATEHPETPGRALEWPAGSLLRLERENDRAAVLAWEPATETTSLHREVDDFLAQPVSIEGPTSSALLSDGALHFTLLEDGQTTYYSGPVAGPFEAQGSATMGWVFGADAPAFLGIECDAQEPSCTLRAERNSLVSEQTFSSAVWSVPVSPEPGGQVLAPEGLVFVLTSASTPAHPLGSWIEAPGYDVLWPAGQRHLGTSSQALHCGYPGTAYFPDLCSDLSVYDTASRDEAVLGARAFLDVGGDAWLGTVVAWLDESCEWGSAGACIETMPCNCYSYYDYRVRSTELRLEPATTAGTVIRVPLPYAQADMKIRIRAFPGRFVVGLLFDSSSSGALLVYSLGV